jgi:hypothetical protein
MLHYYARETLFAHAADAVPSGDIECCLCLLMRVFLRQTIHYRQYAPSQQEKADIFLNKIEEFTTTLVQTLVN